MRGTPSPVHVATVISFALLGAGCQEVVVEDGFRGRARSNPFLAGWRLLESQGWTVEERHGLADLPDPSVVLVLAAASDQSDSGAEQLAAWIEEEGGHLVYVLEGADRFQDDWAADRRKEEPEAEAAQEASPKQTGATEEAADNSLKKSPPEETTPEVTEEERTYPLLETLGLRVRPREAPVQECIIDGKTRSLDMPPGLGVRGRKERRQSREPGVVRNSGKGPAGLLSVPVGEGRLTVIGDAKPWRNRYMGREDHAVLFWEIMTLHGNPDGAWFLSHTRISFFALLWEHGWMAVIAVGVWVALWLWRCIPRFGPLLPDPEPVSRDFLGHLIHAGRFLWARAGSRSVAEPVRRQATSHAVRVVGPMPETGFSDAQWALLSRTCGVPVDRLRWALTGEIPKRRRVFTEMVSVLQTIETSCS